MKQINFSAAFEKLKWNALPKVLIAALSLAMMTSASLSGDSRRSSKRSSRTSSSVSSLKLGRPVLVNTTIDYVLQDATTAIGDLYPTYVPDLTGIRGQYNSYGTPEIFVNPTDSDNIIVLYGQDSFRDRHTEDRLYGGLSNGGTTAAFSLDGGKTFNHSLVAVPAWFATSPSQVTGATAGRNLGSPTADLAFFSDGTAIFGGAFNQTVPALQPPFPSPSLGAKGGMVVRKSFDKGATWTDPVIVSTTESGAFNAGLSSTATSVDAGIGSILVTLQPPRGCCGLGEVAHLSWSKINFEQFTLFGNVAYSRSVDRGNTWSSPIILYDVLNDPVWVANFFNPNFPLGGQAIGAQLISVPSKGKKCGNVLLAGILRLFPRQGTDFTDEPTNTLFDRVVVRSLDNGLNWDPVAIPVGQFVLAFTHDPTTATEFSLIASDGALNNTMAVSPKTGRVYYAWQAGNTQVDSDPNINQFFPQIELSVSADAGLTWTTPAVFSRTPFNPTILGANQAFNVSLAVNKKGYLAVVYEDFRNFDGGTTVVATDVWMDIYKELKNPTGGPYANGLRYVTTVRLNTSSFDAKVGFNSNLGGVGSTTAVAAQNNNFVTAFETTNQANLSQEVGPYGMTMDINNRTNIIFEKLSFGKKSGSSRSSRR